MTRNADWPGTPPSEEGFRRAVRSARRRRRTTQAAAAASVLSVVAVAALVLGERPGEDPVGLVGRPPQRPVPSAAPPLPSSPSLGPVATPSAPPRDAVAASVAASRPAEATSSPSSGPRPAERGVRPRSKVRRSTTTFGLADECDAAWCLRALARRRGDRGWNLSAHACVSSTTASADLTFASSREVDFVVERAGRVVWRWSDGVAARPDPHRTTYLNGGCVQWDIVWDGVRDSAAGHGRRGDVLRVELTSEEKPDTSNASLRLP